MKLRLPMSLVDKAIEDNPKEEYLVKAKENSTLRRYVEIDGLKLTKASLKFMYLETRDSPTAVSGSIAFLYSALKNKKSAKIINMDGAKLALVNYVTNEFIAGYLFKQGDFNSVLPYLVLKIEDNTDADKTYRRPGSGPEVKSVTITIRHADSSGVEHDKTIRLSPTYLYELATARGLESSQVIHPGSRDRNPYCYDFTCREGISVEDIIQSRGFFKETQELHALYQKQRDRFITFLPKYGTQFKVRGEASSSYYLSGENMLVEGKPGRCIMDTIPAFCFAARDNTDSSDSSDDDDEYDGRRRKRSRGDSENDKFSDLESLDIQLTDLSPQDFQKPHALAYHGNVTSDSPLHPTMKIFHLEKQEYYSVHVNNLVPYTYKEDISKFLILPEEMKEMTEMLVGVSNNSEDLEDVIEGKSQSTVITCIGDPGVGKTLMAEVISEACKKPLYKIPADQLGGDAEHIEHNLKTILRRAERWDCVLMIDEANAYIHARGNDIRQNAVVGVFLRRIEYFKGILIVTTNQTRSDDGYDIDDAFLSRSNVVFHLGLPAEWAAKQIWIGQALIQKIEISEKLVDKLVEKFHLSGRSIRKLLKLSYQWATHKKEKLAMKHFDYCFTTIPKTNKECLRTAEEPAAS